MITAANPEQSHGFVPAMRNINPNQSLAFAFAFALAGQEQTQDQKLPRLSARPVDIPVDIPVDNSRKLPLFAQLCAVALEQFRTGNPPDSIATWEGRIGARLIRLGYGYEKSAITRAMAAVEKAHGLVFAAPVSSVANAEPAFPELSASEAAAALSRIFGEVSKRFPNTKNAGPKSMSDVAPVRTVRDVLTDVLAGEQLTRERWPEINALLITTCHAQSVPCDSTIATFALQERFDAQRAGKRVAS